MKTVENLISDILRREGGFTSDPADAAHYGAARNRPGAKWDCSCTNMGVTQATLSDWLGRQATIDEVRTMDEATARHIYATRYFSGPRFDTLPERIQAQMFDIGVNSGPRAAIRLLQSVTNQAGFGPVDVDGILGPQTMRRVKVAEAKMGAALSNALVEERRNFYRRLISARPANAKFERGWMARADEFREAA
ncbi:MAG: glycosyl hydrolase 108 family protein [Rhodospirillaceae bacterium]|nr:glycosyl hydrolase 108 family protein [Rhodospirillaceae bacterium]